MSFTLISYNLGIVKGSPLVTFSTTLSNSTPVQITYEAIVGDKITIVTNNAQLVVANSKLEVPIPLLTTCIKINLLNPFNDRLYKAFTVPDNYEYCFTRPDQDLFLVLNQINDVAINTSGLDHTPLEPGENRVFGHQLGPLRASRAMAITHLGAMEAYIAINGGYDSYIHFTRVPVNGYSKDLITKVAMLEAAYICLNYLYPSHAPRLNALLDAAMAAIPDSSEKTLGLTVGINAGNAVVANRINDGSNHPEVTIGNGYYPSGLPGAWNMDPISQNPLALGAFWADLVTPFVTPSNSTFRCPVVPALTSDEYTCNYNAVKSMGGDDIHTISVRDPDQNQIGIFWAYDGAPTECAPPRLYNQVFRVVTYPLKLEFKKLIRELTVLNVTMADAGSAAWESKYFYKLWRPVTGIRQASSTGNPNTIEDANFYPLGAPATNTLGVNFTPPFPAYPSGHATFGATLFEHLRRITGTDETAFTFVSDEYNGFTKDNQGNVRPWLPRNYARLSQAEIDNGQSRIYLGIHWNIDSKHGITMGHDVANYVNEHLYV